jgi:hypothetical protein
MRRVLVCGSGLISDLPLLKNSKEASNVLDNFAGVFACERLRTARLPKLKCAVDKLVLYLSHPLHPTAILIEFASGQDVQIGEKNLGQLGQLRLLEKHGVWIAIFPFLEPSVTVIYSRQI